MIIKTPDRDPITGKELTHPAPFPESDGYRFRGKGISGTATAGSVTNIDLTLSEVLWLNGVEVLLRGQAFGDYADFEILSGDTVVDRFAADWYFNEDQQNQGVFMVPYPAKVYTGLKIQVVYHSTGVSNVDVRCNLFLHKKAI